MPDGAKALVEGAPGSYAGSRFKEDRVFIEELDAIRRADKPAGADGVGPVPDTRHELVGLALSGGGIRSASFALGIVQALNEKTIFDEIDYMSTVSGGGYTGSCISALLQQHEARAGAADGERPRLPFRHEIGAIEHPAFRHLRNYSNYLAPGKTGRFLRIPALVFQGMVRNFLVILPLVLLAVGALLLWQGDEIRNVLRPSDQPGSPSFDLTLYWPSLVAGSGMLIWILIVAPLFLTARLALANARTDHATAGAHAASRRTPREIRDRLLTITAFIFAGFLAILFINLQPYFVTVVTDYRYGLPVATAVSGVSLATIASKLARRAANVAVARLGDRLLLVGLGLLGPLTLWLIALLLSSWAVSPPEQILGLFPGLHAAVPDWLTPAASWLLPAIFEGDLAACAVAPSSERTIACDAFTETAIQLCFLLAIALVVLFLLVYDVNAASLHSFYRDRLSAAFLFKCDDADPSHPPEAQPYDHLKLSQLSAGRPVHLVNAAINIQSSKTRNMRGRNADFFVFSRLFTGGEYTGYCRTNHLESWDHHVDLGAAMAISGAAVSPNAGLNVNRAFRFLLMLANIRLGYWLRNPSGVRGARGAYDPRGLWRPSPYNFFRELFGRLDETRQYVYVTDGGHIENLGVFELLRRRCKYVIVSDASADPDMSFGSLAQLIRLARIDLGVNIDIDVSDLRKSERGTVRSHAALGAIQYGKGQVGRLLYIKSSVTGDENPYISEYRARHPEFPHESTSDQFFDEAQFEAYRSLGHHIASGLFVERDAEEREERVTRPAPEDDADSKVGAWFSRLSRWLRPRPADLDAFIAIQQGAAALDRRFANALVAPYLAQIYTEYRDLQAKGAVSVETVREVLNLVREQLYLIERAVLVLQLDDPRNWSRPANRGLMNTFRRWSQADLFRYCWAVVIADFTPDLQRFCREALGLRHEIWWRPVANSVAADGNGLNEYEWQEYGRKFAKDHARIDVYMARLYVEPALAPAAGAPQPNSYALPESPGHQPLIEFDVAAAFVERGNGPDLLHCLRIRDTYRGQGLTSPLARTLAKDLPGLASSHPIRLADTSAPPRYALGGIDPDLAASLHFILRKAGFVDRSSETAVPKVVG